MAVRKKYDRNVLGRGLDNISTSKGRGLDALIDTTDIETQGSSNLNEISLNLIDPNPNQPRREFDEAALEELAASIRRSDLSLLLPCAKPTTTDIKSSLANDVGEPHRWQD